MADNLTETDANYIIERYQRLMSEWWLFGTEAQEIADHVLPRKNSILLRRIPGSKRTQRMFDSTAAKAADDLASSIHGTLTSSYIRWFYLETDDPELNEEQPVAEWLMECSLRMNSEFNKSNFSQEAHEAYIDLVCFGTACLFEEEADSPTGGWGGLQFRAQPYGKYVISEGPDGKASAVFRALSMTAQAIRMKPGWTFGDQIADSRPDTQWEVIHGVYPDNERGRTRWRSIYITSKDRSLLHEGEFKEFPYMVPRWTKLSDEAYGRGPSHTALPDVRSLNKIVELELRRIGLDVHPPMKELNGDVIGPIRMVPGGKTTVRNMEGLQPLLSGAQQTFQIVNLKKQELVQSIRNIYYADQLQLPQGPQMTAEEVMTRMELMQRLLGPTAGRLESEFLRPLIDRTWAMLLRASPGILTGNGRPDAPLPPAPPELLQAMQHRQIPLRIRFEGPLARAQKAADAQAISKLQGFVLPMLQVMPELADVIDWDEGVRDSARVLGVPPKIIRDVKQTVDLRQLKAAQQAQQQQMEQTAMAAQAAGQAAPAMKAMQTKPEAGSMMDQMQNGAQQNGGPPQQ